MDARPPNNYVLFTGKEHLTAIMLTESSALTQYSQFSSSRFSSSRRESEPSFERTTLSTVNASTACTDGQIVNGYLAEQIARFTLFCFKKSHNETHDNNNIFFVTVRSRPRYHQVTGFTLA